MNENKLVDLLIAKNYKIASAESLTGGMFASTIVNVPNASKVIEASIVTYSNEAKQKYCGVKKETIKQFDVVSQEVVAEMATGIAIECGADVGVAFSGLAGPTGGTPENPVGTVCIGLFVAGNLVTFKKHFNGSRSEVREKSVDFAINKLIGLLQN